MTLLVTGGAGFIGAHLVKELLRQGHQVFNLDALTYSGNLETLASVAAHPSYRFIHADIRDGDLMQKWVSEIQPQAIFHLAAESHVDKSITGAKAFIETNIIGTFNLLEAARNLQNPDFKFIHVSTDEVYGALSESGFFREDTPYQPNSPYSASKASSDHLARAWHQTYGLPVIITHCSNNYGPYQFPEKLIPTVILNALSESPIPVYGNGQNVRDWLHVADHCDALIQIWKHGRVGETYNIGGGTEMPNLALVQLICAELDELLPRKKGEYADLITFVTDRLGHDFRYAIDISKLQSELGWHPKYDFRTGIHETVKWYLGNEAWWKPLLEQRTQL